MRVNRKPPVTDTKTESIVEDGKLDMVIAFDTTGSMSCYIESVKKHVVELIPKLFESNPNLRLGVVAFGDYCDMVSKDVFGKAYQCLNLTDNQDDIIKFVNSAKNTSGGDGDEFYELVIKKITEETNWRENSEKAVLLIADADPHHPPYKWHGEIYNIDWKEEATKASLKGIKFDTLRILEYSTWYQELSSMTNGVSLPFKNSEKMSNVIYATTLARGGEKTKELFYTTSVTALEDVEMAAVYTAYSKIVSK